MIWPNPLKASAFDKITSQHAQFLESEESILMLTGMDKFIDLR